MQFLSLKVSFNDICILALVLIATMLISISLISMATKY